MHHLDGLAGVVREDLVDPAADPEDLLGVDLDVGGLAAESATRLVDEDPGVGQGVPESGRAPGQQDRRHGGGQAHADGADPRLHVLHGVVDGEAGVDRPPGRVDVEPDVLLGVLAGQEEELGHDHVGHLVVDGGADEDDPVLEQAGVDVHPALTPVRGLDDVGDQGHCQASIPTGRGRALGGGPRLGLPLWGDRAPPGRTASAKHPNRAQTEGIADTDSIKYIDNPG